MSARIHARDYRRQQLTQIACTPGGLEKLRAIYDGQHVPDEFPSRFVGLPGDEKRELIEMILVREFGR